MNRQKFLLSGMHCASCVSVIEHAIKKVAGVEQASVNFASKQATVTGKVSADDILVAIKLAGFAASLIDDELIEDHDHDSRLFYQKIKQSIVAAVVGVPLFVDLFIPWLPSATSAHRQWPLIAIGVVTFIVLWFSGRHIYISFWQSIKSRKGNMYTLIGMGTGVAWGYSMIVVLFPHIIPELARHIYFDTAALLLAFIDLGSALELRARGKTSQAVKRLIGLKPKSARLVMPDGSTVDTPFNEIAIGSMLKLLPGESVAVDGVVVEDESLVDESMLTGESMPVHKRHGDKVFAGTINQTGSILYQATGVGSDTALARIITLVEQAQNTKPAVGRLVDRVASYFVPFVLCLALVTGIAWGIFAPEPKSAYILISVISVLVIACPCALGLATPMSIMVGVGKAAEWGVLIRGGDAIQVATKLDTIVFDKTGTITQGKPKLTDIESVTGDLNRVLQLAASLESQSEHPLARAIIERAKNEDIPLLPVNNFNALSGFGISGHIDGLPILLGNQALMDKEHINTQALAQRYNDTVSQGKTVVFIAEGRNLLGLMAIADTIKPDAAKVVAALRQQGLRVLMLTGDNELAAQAIAQEVGIIDVIAGVLPHQKVDVICALQAKGRCVAMVGDGINDAAALSQSSVGIAMGGGADIAVESADIALMTSALHGVLDVISVSKAVMRNVKQNLFFAFIYNVLGLPIAAGVFYPFTHLLLNPVIAGAAMAMSSVTVVTNAGRLRFLTRKNR